jgi:hypothetical protein
MRALLDPFRHALHPLVRRRVLTGTAVLALALGVAAGAAVFRAGTSETAAPGLTGAGIDVMGIDVITMNLDVPDDSQPDQPRLADELRRTLRAVPGVHSVGIARLIPPARGAAGLEAGGIPLLRARAPSAADLREALDEAIVNEQFAAVLWPGREAVGQMVEWIDSRPGRKTSRRTLRIVEIVRDSRSASIGQIPGPFLYVPSARHATTELADARRFCCRAG